MSFIRHDSAAPSPILELGAMNDVAGGATNGVMGDANHVIKAAKSQLGSSASNTASLKDDFRFLSELVPLVMKEALLQGTSVHNKVVQFKHPRDLMNLLDLTLEDTPTDHETLKKACQDIIKYSVKTGHPHFFNQLYGGMDMYGVAGAWLTEALNTSSYTYEVAPVFTLMEKVLLEEMMKLIGFHDGDGIFCPGGSISNMYGVNLSRFKAFPDIKRTGNSGLPPMCVFTSEKAHYSISKGAALLGLGLDNVITVPVDARGRMCPEALDTAIQEVKDQGRVPIMVNATAGTTVLGSYDPLHQIADVCERHGVWMHVDAAWGGAVLLSPKLRHKMDGVHRCDSLSWNPHKMMGAPLQSSAFFTRHKTLLSECHSAKARYLFQQDKFYDVSFDTGDKSIQCGRKVDCLKLWMMWKAKGTLQFARDIENLFHCAQYLTNKIKAAEGFRLVIDEPECTNVCFWYIPLSMRNQPETPDWWQRLSKVAPCLKQRMVEEGSMLVGYQPDGNHVNFFRMVVANTAATTSHMDFLLTTIQRLGHDL